MKFNDWQLDKLRRGLHSYRALKAESGRPLPWRDVLETMRMTPGMTFRYSESGDTPDFREESLRRFAEGKSTLQPEKLADVKRLLLAAKLVTEDEMKEGADAIGEATTVHAALSSFDQGRQEFFVAWATYRASRSARGGGREEVALRVVAQPMPTLAYIEERVRLPIDANDNPRHARKADCKANFLRRGYGFPATERPAMHLYTRGYSGRDLICYSEVDTYMRGDEVEGELMLHRSGARWTPGISGPLQSTEASLSAYDILCFVPEAKADDKEAADGTAEASA